MSATHPAPGDPAAASFDDLVATTPRASVLVVGPAAAAGAWLRRVTARLARAHAIVLADDPAGFTAGPGGHVSALATVGDLTVGRGLRAALRQDPDALVVDAATTAADLPLLAAAAETGHQVLARVDGADAHAAAAALAAALPYAPGLVFPFVAEVTAEVAAGPARVLGLDPEGPPAVVWERAGGDLVRTAAPLPAAVRPRTPPPPPAPEPPPPLDAAALAAARAALAPHLREAWRPVVAPAADPAAAVAGFARRPLVPAGEAWPACAACGAPLLCCAQLERAALPAPAAARFPARAGWLQVLYCVSSTCAERSPWEAGARNRLLRFLPAAGLVAAAPRDVPDGRSLAPRDVTGWTAFTDGPNFEDLRAADPAAEALREPVQAHHDFAAAWARASAEPVPGLAAPLEELRPLCEVAWGDKLLGWPAWAQAPEWQACPRCGARQELLLQLDADGALPHFFAADGTAIVAQCPAHPDALSLVWACG